MYSASHTYIADRVPPGLCRHIMAAAIIVFATVLFTGQCSNKVDNLRSLFKQHAGATERQLETVLERLDYIEYKLEHLVYYYGGSGGPTKRSILEISDEESDEESDDIMQ